MKKIVGLFLFALLIVGCQTETTYQTVKIKKKYSLELPTFLEPTTELNDEASLQFQNAFKEFYVIVLDEPKANFVNAVATQNLAATADFASYSDLALSNLKGSLADFDFSGIENKTINGMNARTSSITGTIEGIRIYYKVAHIETPTTYYQILSWTLADRKDKYDAEMEKIINSFKAKALRSRGKS